ncbi:NACHT domain-containing protein [Undibacterium sp. CY18W]|uniref:NACHT domain-containing protein n=1 Tax=Undibacterium hunanense TaxID=2762292 RepID=A0ABR6ZWU0_9BURK|nr:NACHT domain-containing protein [Undibacterium hunanense]MBC3920342.1 NACHT domain-containing protein [Undibacterium hunanense]
MTIVADRLPAVPPLSQILAAGTEGGKEFGRVVGLLLFKDAKRHGLEFDLFDDASGDYEGLDGYSRKAKSKDATGYQYKFFPSPLSDGHRKQIRASLDNALTRSKRLRLTKWVLVTPDDLKNSGRREGGGDVEWFADLRDAYRDKVEIEHIGHSKLQAMFLETPSLCLFYYPSLVPSGDIRRKSIQELRSQYDENMRCKYGRIEFVGMSVYKEETSRRISLEDIYIPLSVVPERSGLEVDETPRLNPTKFLSAGAKTVILGDPGSGKSTLLAFLALVGTSKALQSRCAFSEDNRLTIVITLRRYADELKQRKNLSLQDYILEVAKADFNMPSLDRGFYDFYIESGQAIVLFDGLDELPGVGFKSTIRQRVESFTTNYPENTVIITSRLIGYEAEIRFDETYEHCRVAKLRISEIKNFISDWYSVRIDDRSERVRNSDDLIRVISHPDNDSIRALASNPLLLTIVALVHRIDAVLPDQRVVLYQKCTETLLNTWYKAKRHDEEIVKGRVERRNRLRIEAIAYWMHKKSLGNEGRAVVQRNELISFIKSYIAENEKIKESDPPAEDQAEIFLEFINNSAGLLIEAGDGLYSFIHLTFQEYLSATYLAAFGEIGGAQTIWDELGGDLQNPRWREVVRLLVASLKSTVGQKFFIDKLLEKDTLVEDRDTILLLIGLLRDAIEPAEDRATDIIRKTVKRLISLTESEDIRIIESALLNWVAKDSANFDLSLRIFNDFFYDLSSKNRLILSLIRPTVGLPSLTPEQADLVSGEWPEPLSNVLNSLIFCSGNPMSGPSIEEFNIVHSMWALHRTDTNGAAALGMCASILLNNEDASRHLLAREIMLLSVPAYGPHHDHGLNLALLAASVVDLHPMIKKAMFNALTQESSGQEKRQSDSFFGIFLSWIDANSTSKQSKTSRQEQGRIVYSELARRSTQLGINKSLINLNNSHRPQEQFSELQLIRKTLLQKIDSASEAFWPMLRSSTLFSNYFVDSLQSYTPLDPIGHWREALRATLSTSLPNALKRYFDRSEWSQLVSRLKGTTLNSSDVEAAAWLILFDIWVWFRGGYGSGEESPMKDIIDASSVLSNPLLQFALLARAVSINQNAVQEKELAMLISSGNPQITEVLTQAGWPQKEDLLRQANRGKKQNISKTKIKSRGGI